MGCGAASCPAGEKLQVHGQGLVERQVRGPLSVNGPAAVVTFSARRYECQVCGAVMTVVPSGVLTGRLYSAPAIAMALWLFVLDALAGASVRDRVSPWRPAAHGRRRGWAQLYRWVRDACEVFPLPRPVPEGAQIDVVRRVLFALVATAPPGLVASSESARAFAAASAFR